MKRVRIPLSCWLVSMMLAPVSVAAQDATVQTASGPVRGTVASDLTVFKGIPYAAPPLDELRWMPPAPVTPWTEVRDATKFGPAAPQTPDELEIKPGTPTSEDCLTLNVWTPADETGRPVFVWIHGGGFSWGTAQNDLYDGSQFARRGDVVVVTIQYRLGPFGWLHLKNAGGNDFATSGNNGLLDQIAALQWVQDNIAKFGGDPNNVTVAGESAGGISIGAMMASPNAKGLFQKAILQSGSPGLVMTESRADAVAKKLLEFAQMESVDDLRQLTTDEILAASEKLLKSEFSETSFHPVIDGKVIPEPPMQMTGNSADPAIPVMIGTTLDEARYWLHYLPELERLPIEYSRPWLEAITDGRADQVIQAYRQSRPAYSDPQLGMAIIGDVLFRMPAVRLAENLVSHDVPVWMYLFRFKTTLQGGKLGSPHAIDLPFVFNNLTADGARSLIDPTKANHYQAFADQTQNAWIAFMRNGDPNHESLPEWSRYDLTERATMTFDIDPVAELDPLSEEREAWGDIAFDGMHPKLEDSTPTSFAGTRITPSIVIAMIGPAWTAVVVVGLSVLLGGLVMLVRRLLSHRTNRPVNAT